MNHVTRIAPTVYVLNTKPKYYFASVAQARAKYKSMGYSGYSAPVEMIRFSNKQQLLDFVSGQNDGENYGKVTGNNL